MNFSEIFTVRPTLVEVQYIKISTLEALCNYSFGQHVLSLVFVKENDFWYVLVNDENPTVTLWTNNCCLLLYK